MPRWRPASERPDLPWTFRVLDDPLINAFALPGGFIYVTRGILAHFESEAELAGVLGHEIGHVTARHSVNPDEQGPDRPDRPGGGDDPGSRAPAIRRVWPALPCSSSSSSSAGTTSVRPTSWGSGTWAGWGTTQPS